MYDSAMEGIRGDTQFKLLKIGSPARGIARDLLACDKSYPTPQCQRLGRPFITINFSIPSCLAAFVQRQNSEGNGALIAVSLHLEREMKKIKLLYSS